ncbi:MAG: BON domain-containing protein [Candidatus Magnetominusculus sp. LBB02]|nr:BON domain-containing protein [Candidatus Magnetominusculus sp. LBB02]
MKRLFLMSLVMVVGLSLFSVRASTAGETVGEYIDDSTITTEVKAIIIKEPDARSLKIEVTTTQGDVVLQGFINNRETEARLVEQIEVIKGVKSVRSLLKSEKRGS